MLAWLGILLFVVFGMSALAIDLSYLAVTKGELQNAADAAALAAISALKGGQSRKEAIDAAQAVAAKNAATGQSVQLAANDITFGSYDAESDSFEKENFNNASAVRVNARRAADAPGGPVGLFFAGIWGQTSGRPREASYRHAQARPRRAGHHVRSSRIRMRGDRRHARESDAKQALASQYRHQRGGDGTRRSPLDEKQTVRGAVKRMKACPN